MIGQCKGFMVNGTTRRMRVYGTKQDIGLDLNSLNVPQNVQQAIEALRIALEQAYGTPQLAKPMQQKTIASMAHSKLVSLIAK